MNENYNTDSKRHRRSVSQLIASIDEENKTIYLRSLNPESDIMDHPYLYSQFDIEHSFNHSEEYTSSTVAGEPENQREARWLPDFQISTIDSEYDETLAFPDSVTILSNVGDKPILIQRNEDGDEEDSNREIHTGEINFNTLYSPNIKFNSFQRKVFIPGKEVHVRIVDTERSVTTHFLSPNLYTIQLTHGTYCWKIKKRYKHFSSLHQQLSFFRTSLNIPFPTRSHKQKRESLENAANILINVGKFSEASRTDESQQSNSTEIFIKEMPKNETSIKKKKRKLPRFPNKPESLVNVEALPTRIQQLEDYLYNLLNISLYRNHHETLNFVEVSHLSFISGLGIKGKEGMLLKRTGSTRPGQVGCNFCGCLQKNFCVRCNYFCSDVLCGKWRKRWFFVKETCFGYIRPTDGAIRSVILFDQGFDVSTGIYQTGMRKGLQVVTNNRHIVLKCWTKRKCKEWMHYLKNTAKSYSFDFTNPNIHSSYAPQRSGIMCSWYVDGEQYMSSVADALEAAIEEIYISDWWLSPEIYMKRPALDGEYWRLDKILLRKASMGVRVFITLYKEVEMALGINSYYSKQKLVNLHENIKVMRHPDHARVGVFFWAHHEKLIVIDQCYAYLGGIDLCYGRWDNYKHRLTDLGSINTSNSKFEYPTNISENDMIDANHEPSGSYKNETSFIDKSKSNENFQKNEPFFNIEQSLEAIKMNTPEMERKNRLEKLKNNAIQKGKDLVYCLSMAEDDPNTIYLKDPKSFKSSTSRIENKHISYNDTKDLENLKHGDFIGEAKYWYGKDYSNFILKDWMNLEDPLNDIIDRTTTPRMPWHDVGICVIGKSARDVARHFIQRWNAMKLEKTRENISFPYLIPKSYHHIKLNPYIKQEQQQRVSCQLLRSASSWSCGFIEKDLIEQSIHDAYIQTILKAEHYIYIENQFFISLQFVDNSSFSTVRNQIGETIFKRILRAHKERKTFRVYVVMPLLPGFEGDIGGSSGISVRCITHWNYASISRGKAAILNRLRESGIQNPFEYISFHSLRNHSFLKNTPITELIYVHSKLLIADDKVVICGSANINDRSMIGKRDSELAAIIKDEEFEDGQMNGKSYASGRFAGRLRKYLFKEHLGLLENKNKNLKININDPVIDDFWNKTWRHISQRNTAIYDEVFKCIPTNHVKSFANLKKYQEDPPLSKIHPEIAAKKITNIQGFIVDMPLDFLEKEVLTPPSTSKEGLIPTYVWT